MTLTGTPEFEKWVERRIAQDEGRNPKLRRAIECTSCGAALGDPGGIESETCRVCLAAEFGYEAAERQIGLAISRLVGLLLAGEPSRIGAFVSEIAVHASEIVDRLQEDEAAVA